MQKEWKIYLKMHYKIQMLELDYLMMKFYYFNVRKAY